MSNFRQVKNAPIRRYIVACSDDMKNPIYKQLKEEKEKLCVLRKIEEDKISTKEKKKINEKEKKVKFLEKQTKHPKLRLMFWVNDAIRMGCVPYGDLIITSWFDEDLEEMILSYHQALVVYAY